MKIESADKDVRTLLSSGYYKIPRFQRPYSWDRENVSDFWNDITHDNVEDYFIGSMVVYEDSKLLFGIVDGQQRLTTITILLCVLRNQLFDLGLKDLAEGVHSLVERKNIDNKLVFILSTESSYPFFQEYIQKHGEPEVDVEPLTEEQNLKRAFEHLKELVNSVVASIQLDSTLSPDRKKDTIESRLKGIRDAVLNLKLILVQLDNEDDAYIIFETLNTRGKDLSVTDLVKNHLTKNLKSKSASVDPTKIKWEKIRETIEASAAGLSTDTFIHHFWLSRYDNLPMKKLFKAIKSKVKKSNAKDFLDDLSFDANHYRAIHEPYFLTWSKEEQKIVDALNALQLFRVSQPTPCVLSLMRAYKNQDIKNALLKDALVSIEKFHFMFTAVTSQRSSGGISAMYVSLARRIFEAIGTQEIATIIQDLKKKLRERIPSYDEVKALFPEIIYTHNVTKQRQLVKYILSGFHKHGVNSITVNYNNMTIEHLMPQSQIQSGDVDSAIIGQLGNLILIPSELNGKLGDKPFLEKKKILLQAHVQLPDIVREANVWGAEQIIERTNQLSSLAYNSVWRI